ncbi:MAG TPA: calcium/sodium antiporter [Candidatus Rifleibacterium sp.]|nr:calcium/sodium antiporter [Candidatus Rifleibacterium sp.]HPT47663.1 calcium/sodium antiporter [Candidatus Rifleibacterium sp.]
MLPSLLLCVIGFVILTYAADKLVEGASNLAFNLGVSKMVVGLTIVAAGTSLPELVVSVNASIKGNPALSLGNVVGSNIMNVALILGIASLIQPIVCEKQMVRRETPIMIAVSGLVWYMAYTDNKISPYEGVLLLALFISYTIMSYILGRRENAIAEEIKEKANHVLEIEDKPEKPLTTGQNVFYVLGGLVGLVIGAEALVRGSVTIAQSMGVSDEVIGLTLIAIGTSLPELATSIVAARRGQSDIAVGNVVGSNIFNLLGIVGCAAALPLFMPAATEANYLIVSENMLGIHIPLMFVVGLGVLPIMYTGMKIVRLEGAFLIAAYIAYSVMLYQTAGSDAPVPPPPGKATTQAPANGNGQPGLPAVISPDSMPLPELTAPPATLTIPASETVPVLNDAQQTLQGSDTPGIQAPEVITASGTP